MTVNDACWCQTDLPLADWTHADFLFLTSLSVLRLQNSWWIYINGWNHFQFRSIFRSGWHRDFGRGLPILSSQTKTSSQIPCTHLLIVKGWKMNWMFDYIEIYHCENNVQPIGELRLFTFLTFRLFTVMKRSVEKCDVIFWKYSYSGPCGRWRQNVAIWLWIVVWTATSNVNSETDGGNIWKPNKPRWSATDAELGTLNIVRTPSSKLTKLIKINKFLNAELRSQLHHPSVTSYEYVEYMRICCRILKPSRRWYACEIVFVWSSKEFVKIE